MLPYLVELDVFNGILTWRFPNKLSAVPKPLIGRWRKSSRFTLQSYSSTFSSDCWLWLFSNLCILYEKQNDIFSFVVVNSPWYSNSFNASFISIVFSPVINWPRRILRLLKSTRNEYAAFPSLEHDPIRSISLVEYLTPGTFPANSFHHGQLLVWFFVSKISDSFFNLEKPSVFMYWFSVYFHPLLWSI